jgi:phosphate starvation-inducible PhoH-like protein
MGKRSSHGGMALRLAETGYPGTVEPWSPLAGPDADREQGYLRRIPPGTGKTYLAVSAAVAALEAGEVGRIVLTRPAVEAGEKLGYLPGDIGQKLAPICARSTMR